MPNAPKTHLQRMRAAGTLPPSRCYKATRTESDKFRSSVRWQKCRASHKRMNPLCCDPFGTHARVGELAPVNETHHIVPVAKAPELALDFDNLASLCFGCHARLGVMEKQGQRTCQLFSKTDGRYGA